MIIHAKLLEGINEKLKHAHNKFNINDIEKIFHLLLKNPKISITYLNYYPYYNFKKDEAGLNRKKYILLGQYEKAAEWRKTEQKFSGKFELLNEPKLTVKSKFYFEGNFVIYCFHRENDKDKQIIKLIESFTENHQKIKN